MRHSVEKSLAPDPAFTQDEGMKWWHWRRAWRYYLLLVFFVLALVFVGQNGHNVRAQFLWMTRVGSLSTLLLWTLLAGFAAGALVRK